MAKMMSPEEYQELGRRYYKLKQYEKAIEILTQGIDALPTLGLYDHRAASYDKLKDFDAAVKDGREMIKLDKKEVKGYLRTASVLERMEKPDTALGIYKYGMKHVPVSDKNFKVGKWVDAYCEKWLISSQLLQQLHDKLTRTLSPPTSIDPFTILPVELAEMVLTYLSFRHMVNCMRVCRGWRDYLARLPELWLHLDLSAARRPVRRSFVAYAVRCSRERMTRVTIHRFEHMDVLKNIAKACKNLAELEIISSPHAMSSTLVEVVQSAVNLKKFIIRPDITLDTAAQILRHRPELEHVEYGIKVLPNNPDWKGPFAALKTFSMEMDTYTSARGLLLIQFLRQAPCLQSLRLVDVLLMDVNWPLVLSQLPPLRELSLRRTKFDGFLLLPPTLERLDMELRSHYPTPDISILLQRSHVPKLTHLRLVGFDTLKVDWLQDLLDLHQDEEGVVKPVTGATPLQSISIRGVLDVGGAHQRLFGGHDSLFGRSPRILTPALLSLDIATMPCTDDDIEHLLAYETGIQTIDLSSTRITGASIKMLADKLPTLQGIKADNCAKINGREAIEYAERKGISVSYKMQELKSERKVRY